MVIKAPTDANYELAAKVAAWMGELSEIEQSSDYLHNLGIYGKAGVVNLKGIGLVASAISAYLREEAKKREMEAGPAVVSKHLGEIGERLTLKVKLVGVYESLGEFGVTFIQKFEVAEGVDTGARLTWFGSSRLFVLDENRRAKYFAQGDTFWIKGTVKRHSEFKGIKETTINRVDLAEDPVEAKAKKAAAAKAARGAKKAREAARKAFGEEKVVAVYAHKDFYAGVQEPSLRIVQVAENEFCIDSCRYGEWVTDRKNSFETIEEAKATRGYIGQMTLLSDA